MKSSVSVRLKLMRTESFTGDGVELLNQVNKSHVKIFVLFPTFLFNLSGHNDRARSSSRRPEATLAGRWLNRTRETVFPATERRAMPR